MSMIYEESDRKAHLEDFLVVVLKNVERLLQLPHVMQSYLNM